MSAPDDSDQRAVAARFRREVFTDPQTGERLPYNLFVPDGVEKMDGPLPLVIFIHDAGSLGADPSITLRQGDGATCWATAADQAIRPAYVLAPQYPRRVVDDFDGHIVDPLLDTTIGLIDQLLIEHHVDPTRVYATGQSMGGMMEIVLGARRPDLIAASFLVACQWDPAVVAPLVDQHIWILVSEGDAKAFPGQLAIVDELERAGAAVIRATTSVDRLEAEALNLAASGARVIFTALEADSMPIDDRGNPLQHHMGTWPIAYQVEPIRAWMFDQRRDRSGTSVGA